MKHLIIMILSTVSIFAGARDYLPILAEGKSWTWIEYSGMREPKVNYLHFKVNGDTIVNNRTCKRISCNEWENSIAAYETDGKLFLCNLYGEENVLMIDMNLKKGDNLYDIDNNKKVFIKDDDIYEQDGVSRKRIKLPLGNLAYWIEGIGATEDQWATNIIRPTNAVSLYLESCYDNDVCIFKNENLPDFVTAGIKNTSIERYCTEKYYDLQGRGLNKSNNKGIVIMKGKKILMK